MLHTKALGIHVKTSLSRSLIWRSSVSTLASTLHFSVKSHQSRDTIPSRNSTIFFHTQYIRPLSLSAKLLQAQSQQSSAPPFPPPPSSSKDAKGERILSKIVRAFTFSASSVIVLAAAGVSLLVIYLIFSELFLPSGDTRTLNKAVSLIEKDERAQALLNFGKGDRLKAYGELPGDAWVRNRPVRSTRQRGQDGKDRLYMRFHVESDAGKHGSVSLEQVDTSYWSSSFQYIALDVPGNPLTYIVEPSFKSKLLVPRFDKSKGFLGLNWGPRGDKE